MMSNKKALAYKVVTVVMTVLLTLNTSPFTMLASRAVAAETQQTISSDTGSEEATLNTAVDGVSDGDSTEVSKQDGDTTSTEGSTSSQMSGEESAEGEKNSNESALSLEGNGETLALSDSNDGEQSSSGDTNRDAESFDANSYVSKLSLFLSSGDKSATYELPGDTQPDTSADFPEGLARSATYVANLTIDTQKMANDQGKYPLVVGDSLTCRVPDLIRTGGTTTSGRLRDTTADWDSKHDGVGTYTVSQDAEGHNVLTITYDDGYITEKNGKILSSSVRLSGGFDTSSQTTESFETQLFFGNLTVQTTFSKLEIIRNLSIEKTGETDLWGPYDSNSTPGYPRRGGATVDSDGYLTYSVKVSAGADNTYKLTNVKVTDLFDAASQAKVDLSTMKLVSVVNDGTTTTDKATPLYDASGNINGWIIGDLGIGCSATVQFKVKLNKDGVTDAVSKAKKEDASSDALDARTIKNTATAIADDTDPVSHDYSTVVKNYVQVSKSVASFDSATQKQHFKITVTAPADNRYTMYDVPIKDSLTSGYLDASYYKGSGIDSMSVRHSDGTTSLLAYSDFKQINSLGASDSRAWYARISEIRPGDTITIDAYLELDESYWSHSAGSGLVGNSSSTYNYVYVGNVGENNYYANDINQTNYWSYFKLIKTVLGKSASDIDESDGTIKWTIRGNERNKSKEPTYVGGLKLTDQLGANQKFTGNEATVTFIYPDGKKAEKNFVLADGSTSFEYTIPEEYGYCEYIITYTSTITDWDTYVGPAKKYTNKVNDISASTSDRPRVAAMSKQFVRQEDDWSEWKTEIYSELQNGDTYQDTSRRGIGHMYFTDDDLAAISLTIDGVALDSSLYQIDPVQSGSSDGKYSSYLITFKGNVSVSKDGQTLKPSKDHPLVVSYKAHMTNPPYGDRWDYYNDAKLTAGNVQDTDNDYCRRKNAQEVYKYVSSSTYGSIKWYLRANYFGYSGRPDGTCTLTDTLPAGLTYVSCNTVSKEKWGKIDSVTPVVNDDGTTTLTIKLSGLQHDEVCKANPTDDNQNKEFQFEIATKITDPEYLYGTESKTFNYTNTVSLNDRYGNLKTSSATASIKHVAMKKTMTYTQATAPYAQFSIEVNKDKADLNPSGSTVRIVDESSKSLSIDTKSIQVVNATTGDPVDFTVDASQMANNIFVVEIPDDQYVKITYQAQVVGVVDQNVSVNNNAYFEGYRTTSGESTIDQLVTVLNTSGQAESEPMIWFSKKNESAQALGGATYKLEVYNVDIDTNIGTWETVRTDITSTDDDDVKGVKVESLELGKLYRLVETGAPDGYVLDATPHYFVLYKDVVPEIVYPAGVSEEDVFTGPSGSLVTAYDSPYTKVRFTKVSDDNVQLAGAEFAVYSVDSEGTASDTPALDKDGNQVVFTSSADSMNEFTIAPGTYKLVETKTPAGYQTADPVTFEVKGDAQRTVTVGGQTVQYGTGDSINGSVNMVDETRTTSLEVTKTWDDCSNFDGIRPKSATVQLVADGELVDGKTLELNEGNNWTASFDDLAVMKNGKKVEYSVKELDPLDRTPVGSGEALSNCYKVTISATTGDVASGKDEKYSVGVTNSYTPTATEVQVSKDWDDESDQDGVRPKSIQVQLFADGVAMAGKTATLNAVGQWFASFENLTAAHADGSAVVYSVKEIDPKTGNPVDYGSTLSNGYTVQLTSSFYAGYPEGKNPTGDDAATAISGEIRNVMYTLENSRAVDTTSIEVEKKWVGPAAESATVKLQSSEDGKEWADVEDASAVLSEEAGWSHTFESLPVYAVGKQGVKLTYRVVEDALENYETTYLVSGKDSDGTVTPVAGKTEKVTIVNTNTEKVAISGTKVWDDASNQDGKRPESVTVRLLADGKEVAKKDVTAKDATKDNSNSWSFSFGDLAKYDTTDGHEIAYTLTEDAVTNYTSKVEGSVADGFVVTNSYTPEATSIDVEKKWAGPVAESVTVKLQSSEDGKEWADVEDASAVLSEEAGWSHTFESLPVYAVGKQGVKLTYRVVEDALENYETTYLVSGKDSDGTVTPVAGKTEKVTIVNTNTEKVAISGTKVWDDASNQDGKRPESVTVRLLADGEEVDSKELTAADATEGNSDVWSFSFGDLAKYDTTDGHQIAYSLTEDTVEGYTSKVEGSVADGFVVTNTKNEEKTPSEPQDKKTDKPKTEKPLPQTGDSSSMAQFVSVIALLLLVPGLVLRRRQ